MKKASGFVLVSAGLLLASQVFFMTIEEALDFTESVVIAEVNYIVTFPMDLYDRTEYGFSVIDVVSGEDALQGELFAQHFMELCLLPGWMKKVTKCGNLP